MSLCSAYAPDSPRLSGGLSGSPRGRLSAKQVLDALTDAMVKFVDKWYFSPAFLEGEPYAYEADERAFTKDDAYGGSGAVRKACKGDDSDDIDVDSAYLPATPHIEAEQKEEAPHELLLIEVPAAAAAPDSAPVESQRSTAVVTGAAADGGVETVEGTAAETATAAVPKSTRKHGKRTKKAKAPPSKAAVAAARPAEHIPRALALATRAVGTAAMPKPKDAPMRARKLRSSRQPARAKQVAVRV